MTGWPIEILGNDRAFGGLVLLWAFGYAVVFPATAWFLYPIRRKGGKV